MDATTGYFPGAIARPGPASALRAVLREALQGARLVGTLARSLHPGGAPRIVFLPSDGRRMSSLLRIYTLARALAAEGWACSVLPATLDLRSRRRALSWLKPDVVVMQGARHALNRPSLYPGQRIIYDMDDADFHLEHLAAPVREAMGQVESVIAGSQYVADWCMAHGARADIVWTGTPVSRQPWRPQDRRGPVVAWAQSAPVDYVQERAFVVEVMTALVARHPGVRLRLYGRRPQDDDTILAPFRAAGIATEWLPQMRYARFLASLEDVSVGLSPVCPETPFSRGKSFGKILAYLDRGVPVIASDRVDHPRFFAPGTGILSNEPSVWVREADRLLRDPVARQTMAEDAHARFLDTFAPSVVARLVDPILRRALAPARADARSGVPGSTARAA